MKNKILVVNDDGITSLRTLDLAKRLEKYGDVTICVPDKQMSASSHSINIWEFDSKYLKEESKEPLIYSHNGSPADSVRYMMDIKNESFDYCFSGVNYGFNLGVDNVYSGTVGAALEASIYNIKAVALSTSAKDTANYQDYLDDVLEYIFNKAVFPKKGILSFNFPEFVTSNVIKMCPMALSYSKPNPDTDLVLCKTKGFITVSPLGIDMTLKDYL